MVNKSTKKKAKAVSPVFASDPDSLVRFADLLKLRSLAPTTQVGYLRFVRKLALRKKCDPATVDEANVREHLLHLKEQQHFSPSSMRTACAAFQLFYRSVCERDWKLFDLVHSPSTLKLPEVLTRAEVARLFAVIREHRFRMILRLIYACGLRVSEAINLEVSDIKRDGPRLHLHRTKGQKERFVPLPLWCYRELQDYWRTHQHPRWIFPGTGQGWHDKDSNIKMAKATEPMSDSSIQHCMQLARTQARLPATTHVHTLRHSYATHLLEEGVSIRLISAYLGHTSLETTLIYTHLTAVNEASARAALDRLRPAA